MYHFVADHPPVPVRLSFRASVPGHVRQYLKQFQIDAIQFMHNFLAKGEFCCYNDESGLGKQATVATLLDAACVNKKTLIVVQNDDIYVHGWEFHFSVLTNSSVTVIKESKDSTNTPHNVYIAKWSTLRAIDDLSKFDFDFIIVDNRGQMLNNSFCTSMLLKHYERKINILISSVDITSDLKLLHNILKLGGRLDPRYSSFKTFEEKFRLPDSKDLIYKKIDLEEYFLKRERLADYCKHYRLRRYCHQFEQHLPLVTADRYKINLEVWREKQNATNSEGSSVAVTSQNRTNEKIRDTQELFEEYCRQRRKIQERTKLKQQQQQEKEQQQRREQEQIEQEKKRLDALSLKVTDIEEVYNVDDEVGLINSTSPVLQPVVSREITEDGVLMSPLLVVSDSEDLDDVPELCNDPNDGTDVVDLSSDEENCQNEKSRDLQSANRNENKGTINDLLSDEENYNNGNINALSLEEECYDNESDRKDCEKDKHESECQEPGVCIKKTRKKHFSEVDRLKADVATNLKFQNETTPKGRTRHTEKAFPTKSGNSPSPGSRLINNKTRINVNKSVIRDTNKKTCNERAIHSNQLKEKQDAFVKRADKQQNEKKSSAEEYKEVKLTKTEKNKTSTRSSRFNCRPAMQQNQATTDVSSNVVIKIESDDEQQAAPTRRCNIKLDRIKRELSIDHLPLNVRDTRSMQRTTRLKASSSKYSFVNLSLNKDKSRSKKTPEKVKSGNKQNLQTNKSQSAKGIIDTQASLITMTCSQEYEPMQCAQRLSEIGVSESTTQRKSPEFVVPPTPPAPSRNSLIPSSFASSNGLCPDSDLVFLPPSSSMARTCNAKGKQGTENVIILSGSETDNSISTTSRRTRALKPRRKQKPTEDGEGNVPTFSQLLAQHNTCRNTKSPDLFSNCSDLGQLTLSQPPAANAEDEPNVPFEGFKIFGSEVKQLQQHYALSKPQISNTSGNKTLCNRSCLDILENMFEPKNRKSKSTATISATDTEGKSVQQKKTTQKRRTQNPIVPNHPIEAIVEAKAQQEAKKKRSLGLPLNEDEIFEITNNGTFGSVMRLHSNGDISPVQQTPKSHKIPNKITKYFMGGLTQNITSSQEDSDNNVESGTPSKKQQQHQQTSSTQGINSKKSPKQKHNPTQVTKLTKWFTKNSPSKQLQTQTQVSEKPSGVKKTLTTGKRQVKRRRLDLSQVKNDINCI